MLLYQYIYKKTFTIKISIKMSFCKEIYKNIFSYIQPLDAVKLSLSSKYIYDIIRTIKYNRYIDINLNFDENNENPCKILHSLKNWTNLKFRIIVPEHNTFEELKILFPSYDNLYYSFNGDYSIASEYINNNEVIINSMLPKNILHLKPRLLTDIHDIKLFTSLFKNVKRIDMLSLHHFYDITDLSFLQDIKIKNLIIHCCFNIKSLDPIKDCGIKMLYLYNFNMNIFNDENCFNSLKKIDYIEFSPTKRSLKRASPTIKDRWEKVKELPNVCVY